MDGWKQEGREGDEGGRFNVSQTQRDQFLDINFLFAPVAEMPNKLSGPPV